MKRKLSYAWVRNTPLFKAVSTWLTFDEKHKLALDLMVEHSKEGAVDFKEKSLVYSFSWVRSHLGEDVWYNWWDKTKGDL